MDDNDTDWIVWIILFFVSAYSMLGHILINLYENTKQLFPSQENEHNKLLPTEIKEHTLLVKGLKKDIKASKAKKLIENLLYCKNGDRNDHEF